MSLRIVALLVLLSLVQLCLGNGVAFNASLMLGETFNSALLNGTAFPQAPGKVNITFTSSFSAELCIQEGLLIQGPLSVCNPGGYFVFNLNSSNSSTEIFELDMASDLLFRDFDKLNQAYYTSFSSAAAPQTFTNKTLLRPGSYYYVQVRPMNVAENVSAEFHLEVTWNTPCNGQYAVASANGKCVYPAQFVSENSNQFQGSSVNYFQLSVDADANLEQILFTSGYSDHADIIINANNNNTTNNTAVPMLLRRGSAPDKSTFDAQSTVVNGSSVLSFDFPAPGLWYLAVYNPSTQPQFIQVNSTAQACGANCTNVVDLTSMSNVTLQTGTGNLQYFLVKNTQLSVGTGTEDVEDEAPVIYVSTLNYPTNESYQLTSSGNTVNFIQAESDSGVWRIAVVFEEGEEYYIWANSLCPNDCVGDIDPDEGNATAHGHCNIVNGVSTGSCVCDDGYGDLTCTSSGLATVWIVLIVIACIIILAIAIGIPLAIYLKNRRRARYERV